MLDKHPKFRKIRIKRLAEIEFFKERQIEEDRKIDKMLEVLQQKEERENQEFKMNEEAIRQKEVEKAIDTIMKDEWNRVRIAQVFLVLINSIATIE
jgi:hypothetical protein